MGGQCWASLRLSVFPHFLLGSSWKPRTPRLSWPPWRERRKGGRRALLVSQFSGRGRRPGAGSRLFYHLFLLQGDCEDGAPGLPGQPGIPGERVSVGPRGSECGGQGPSPQPQPATLYSILITKPKSLNPFQGLRGLPGDAGPKVSAGTSLGAQWLKLRASSTAGAALIREPRPHMLHGQKKRS